MGQTNSIYDWDYDPMLEEYTFVLPDDRILHVSSLEADAEFNTPGTNDPEFWIKKLEAGLAEGGIFITG